MTHSQLEISCSLSFSEVRVEVEFSVALCTERRQLNHKVNRDKALTQA